MSFFPAPKFNLCLTAFCATALLACAETEEVGSGQADEPTTTITQALSATGLSVTARRRSSR